MDNAENSKEKPFVGAPLSKVAKQKRRARTKKSSNLYIDKEEMMAELVKYSESPDGEISEELGAMFLKLAIRYTSKPNLSGYTYREEFIGAGVLRMISQIAKFDVNHPARNPFAYFTQVICNETMGILNREKKQRNIKDKLRDKIWEEVQEVEGIDVQASNSNVNDL